MVVLLGGTMAFYLVRTMPRIEVGRVTVLGTDADLRIDQAHMVQNNQGRKEWEMWAETALVYRKKDETHLQDLRMRLYSRDGKPTDISARRGVMGNQRRNVTVSGDVVIRTSDGVTLRTDSLRYDPQEHRVDSEDLIVLNGSTFHLTGVGLKGNTETGHYVLLEKVRAVITEAQGPPPAAGVLAPPAAEEKP